MANFYGSAGRSDDNFYRNYISQIKISDEDFVKRWTSSAKYSQNHSSVQKDNKINMFDTRQIILEVLDANAQIRETESFLRTNVSSLSDEQFRDKLEAIEKLKTDVGVKVKVLNDDSTMTLLKNKLAKRRSKRQRLRRRKNEINAQKSIQRQLNASKCDDINKWLEKNKIDIENKQKALELKIKADAVLKDVNRRKAEARKNISLLDTLSKLREAREKSAKGRGEIVNVSDKQIFISSIDKLKLLWSNAMTKYELEEKQLKDTLNSDPDENLPHVAPIIVDKADSIINEWKCAMFGASDAMPHRNFNGNIYHFINIRQQWDQYLDVDGSRIPFGWLKPSPLTNKWKECLEK